MMGLTNAQAQQYQEEGDLDLAMFPRGGYRDRHIVRGK